MSKSIFKDWVSNVHVTNTLGRGWCVRIDGCNVFDEINQYGVKPRITFAIASDLKSQEEAKQFAINWLRVQSNLHDYDLVIKQAEQIKMLMWLVDSANQKLGSVRDALYGQNLSISGWHLNGQLEPVDNWFDSNDWDPVLSLEATKPVEE